MLSDKWKRQLILGITLATSATFISLMVQATDTFYSADQHFMFTFYNENEPWNYGLYHNSSEYTLNDWEKRHIVAGGTYWEHVLASSFINMSAIPIMVVTDPFSNAGTHNEFTAQPINNYYLTELEASMRYQYTLSGGRSDAVFITFGKPLFPPDQTLEEVYLTPLPQLAGGPHGALVLTMIHEMGHALGLYAEDSYILFGDKNGIGTIYCNYLYDWRGIHATPNMAIRTNNHKITAETYFDLPGIDGDSSFKGMKLPYFSGPHVAAVLDGATIAVYNREGTKLDQSAVPGVPITSVESTLSGEYAERVDLSHPEIHNSMMSHQLFRNYSTFTEVEMAILQDLGYTIDLRNFYGRSIYNNGLSITNTSPYYARNDAGTDYITGTANKETYGIGLHVYGNNNTIYQAADLLADGDAAVGIRLDGLDNNIIVNNGTKIEANGLNGNGILVAFGKNHTVSLAQGSTVTALGTGGIGAAFDFGTNMMGYYCSARATYASRGYFTDQPASSIEVDGPLVTDFNVNGTLAGTKAAIYMSSNAYVKNITIGAGAAITGDITNDWLYDYPDIVNYGKQAHAAYPNTIPENIDKYFFRQYKGTDELTTKLSFANTDGMVYSGNITGQKNTRLSFDAGTTAYTGTAKVLSADIAAGAALIGNGMFSLMTPADAATHTLSYVLNPYDTSGNRTLTDVGLFTNHGTIAPTSGNISIMGDFISDGTIGAVMTSPSQVNVINVSGSADLTGSKLSLISNVVPLVGKTYNYLTGNTVTGTVTPVSLSPYVTLSTGINGSNAYFSTTQTQPLGSLPSMTPSENSVGAALDKDLLNHIANNPNATSTATMNNLLYQDIASSQSSIKQITASDRAQLITVSPLTAMTIGATYDRLDTALLDGNINVNVPVASFDGVPMTIKTTAPMTLDTTNNLWIKFLRGYESYGGVDGGYDLDNKSFGGVIGYDRAVNGTTRVGGLFSYAKTDYSTDVLDGKSHDWRVGVYASHDNGTWKTQGLISYGHNRYDFNRYVLGDKLYSDYTAKVFDINAKVKYLPQYNRVKSWQVAPYLGLAYTHANQGAYTESGTSAFAQSIDSVSNNSYRAEVGVEWKHNMSKDSSFGGSIGYKHILSGVNPELNGTFAGDTNRFRLSSDNDRDYVTYSMNLKKNTGHNWTMQGEIRGERSKHNHSEVYSVMAKYSF